tara:strand:+ start:11999 stop:13006 length:1008 start_codon:yes stop_codon:yes gene_type:complete
VFNFKQKNTYIIAEACDNHFGELSIAKKMALQAKKAGADIVKFQHHLPDEEMLPIVPKSKNFKISLYEFLKKYSLKIKDHENLKEFCKKIKIQYLCTPFSYKAACELNEIGVDFFKIGSGEFLDLPYVKKICEFKKPVIFSTGMSKIKEIDFMYKFINKHKKNKVAFMNCTSEYPPKFEDINLGFIPIMKKKYKKFIIGHSDHTNSIYSSIVAVAFGAKIIEKHFFVDNKNYGPDRHVSISVDQLRELVISIQNIEKSLGDKKKIYQKEKEIEKWAKRSLVSIKNISKGEKLSEKNIWSKRPGTGIPSKMYFKYLGKKARKNILVNTLINRKDFL